MLSKALAVSPTSQGVQGSPGLSVRRRLVGVPPLSLSTAAVVPVSVPVGTAVLSSTCTPPASQSGGSRVELFSPPSADLFTPLSASSAASSDSGLGDFSSDLSELRRIQARINAGEAPVSTRKLGAGSFGVVSCLTFEDGVVVAVKDFYRIATAQSEICKAEGLLKKGAHPNIASYLPVTFEGKPALICPYLPYSFDQLGKVIYDGLRSPATSPEDKKLLSLVLMEACIQVLSGIAHFNRHRLSHLDVRDDNVRISRDGRVVLCDVGTVSKQGSEFIKGARGTMEPEVPAGGRVAPQTDVWSATMLLLGLVTKLSKLPTFSSDVDERERRLIFQVASHASNTDNPDVAHGLKAGEFATVQLTESLSEAPLAAGLVRTMAQGGLRPREERRSAEELVAQLTGELVKELGQYNAERSGASPLSRAALIPELITRYAL